MKKKKPQRNGHAFHPIMRKGGVHEKTAKAQRKADKQSLLKLIQQPSFGNPKDGFDLLRAAFMIAHSFLI